MGRVEGDEIVLHCYLYLVLDVIRSPFCIWVCGWSGKRVSEMEWMELICFSLYLSVETVPDFVYSFLCIEAVGGRTALSPSLIIMFVVRVCVLLLLYCSVDFKRIAHGR